MTESSLVRRAHFHGRDEKLSIQVCVFHRAKEIAVRIPAFRIFNITVEHTQG
jgi:hypothetical protein